MATNIVKIVDLDFDGVRFPVFIDDNIPENLYEIGTKLFLPETKTDFIVKGRKKDHIDNIDYTIKRKIANISDGKASLATVQRNTETETIAIVKKIEGKKISDENYFVICTNVRDQLYVGQEIETNILIGDEYDKIKIGIAEIKTMNRSFIYDNISNRKVLPPPLYKRGQATELLCLDKEQKFYGIICEEYFPLFHDLERENEREEWNERVRQYKILERSEQK